MALEGFPSLGDGVETGFVPFVVVVAEVGATAEAYAFEAALRLGDAGGDAVEKGVGGPLVFGGGGLAVKVGGDVFEGQVKLEDLVFDFPWVAVAVFNAVVDFFGEVLPVGEVGVVGAQIFGLVFQSYEVFLRVERGESGKFSTNLWKGQMVRL